MFAFLRLFRVFFFTAIFILWFTAIAKIGTVLTHAPVIKRVDPVLGIKNQYIMSVAGFAELGAVLCCLLLKNYLYRFLIINFISINIIFYRLLLITTGFKGYGCPCLGAVPFYLPFTEQTWRYLLLSLAFYLFSGSTIFLIVFLKNADAFKK
ncbi:MAG: hypothetical protein J7M06_05050 [Proteobacteria bacterium]|nr:hypothetical protein [Pseudomonadota bacterium]